MPQNARTVRQCVRARRELELQRIRTTQSQNTRTARQNARARRELELQQIRVTQLENARTERQNARARRELERQQNSSTVTIGDQTERQPARAQRELESQPIFSTLPQSARTERQNARAQRELERQQNSSTIMIGAQTKRQTARARRELESQPVLWNRNQFWVSQSPRTERQNARAQREQERAQGDQAIQQLPRTNSLGMDLLSLAQQIPITYLQNVRTNQQRVQSHFTISPFGYSWRPTQIGIFNETRAESGREINGNLVEKVFENCTGEITTSTEECCICMKDVEHPIGCTSCKKLVGCLSCCKQWAQSSMERAGQVSCPLCRNEWTTSANVEEFVPTDE